jgi:hypothetical protein
MSKRLGVVADGYNPSYCVVKQERERGERERENNPYPQGVHSLVEGDK